MSAHYRATRWGLEVLGRVFFGLRTEGRHWIPKEGGLLIASNHRSVFDPVVVGTAARRELHYLAKEELFRNPFVAGVLRAYNAFPVRRGAADRKALTRVIRLLRQGEESRPRLLAGATRNGHGGCTSASSHSPCRGTRYQ
jgi:1-acyl-sn-glycerol-3-phosphate acyltransferase